MSLRFCIDMVIYLQIGETFAFLKINRRKMMGFNSGVKPIYILWNITWTKI